MPMKEVLRMPGALCPPPASPVCLRSQILPQCTLCSKLSKRAYPLAAFWLLRWPPLDTGSYNLPVILLFFFTPHFRMMLNFVETQRKWGKFYLKSYILACYISSHLLPNVLLATSFLRYHPGSPHLVSICSELKTIFLKVFFVMTKMNMANIFPHITSFKHSGFRLRISSNIDIQL